MHLYESGLVYLLTAVTYRRIPIFRNQKFAQIAHEDIKFYTRKFRAEDLAHVIMPDHIHWVIRPSIENFDQFTRDQQKGMKKYSRSPENYYLSKIMEDYKRHVSYSINRVRGTKHPQIWQPGFYDEVLSTTDAILNAVRYTLYNPVKDGLVEERDKYRFIGGDGLTWEYF